MAPWTSPSVRRRSIAILRAGLAPEQLLPRDLAHHACCVQTTQRLGRPFFLDFKVALHQLPVVLAEAKDAANIVQSDGVVGVGDLLGAGALLVLRDNGLQEDARPTHA